MNKNTDFEQNYFSEAAKGNYKIGNDSIRIRKWLACFDRSLYDNLDYCGFKVRFLSCLNQTSER